MSSAAEAELGALYLNSNKAIYLCQILIKIGNPQPQTPVKTNNTTADVVVNNTIQPTCTKVMDKQFHWLHNIEAQGQFKIYWRPGGNTSGLLYKSSSAVNVRAKFLTRVKDLAEARCTKIKRQTKTSSSKPAKLHGCVSQAILQDLA
jgi:hypothetical protein